MTETFEETVAATQTRKIRETLEELGTYTGVQFRLRDPNTGDTEYEALFRGRAAEGKFWFTGVGRSGGEYFLRPEDIRQLKIVVTGGFD